MNADEIEHWLAGRLADLLGRSPERIDPTSTFARFGLASVELVGLLGALEDWLGKPVDQTAAYEWPTPRQLAIALAGGNAERRDEVTAPDDADRLDEQDPVVIVGLACRFPAGADTPDLFWRNLARGVDAVGEPPRDRWGDDIKDAGPVPRRGAFLPDIAGWDAEFFEVSPQEALRTDPQQRLLMELAWEALEDAGIPAARCAGTRTSFVAGLMDTGQYPRLQLDHHGDAALTDPHFGLGSSSSAAAGRIAHLLDLRGPAYTVDTACSSSLVAVHLAAQCLRRGEADLALAAGVSLMTHPDFHVQACAMSMLSPDGRCKTFDESADGFAVGEGGGVVVLERMSAARRNGHRIHAVLRGSAVNQDGHSNGLTAPNRAAQVAVIRDALSDAGVAPAQIGYVEAHGSGTRLGDAIELAALHEVFDGDAREWPLPVGAVKTNVGHTLAAAGMAGLIKTVQALRNGKIPPSLHLDRPVDGVSGTVRAISAPIPFPAGASGRLAGVSSFGWSGTNAHVVLEEPPAPVPNPAARHGGHLLVLSARTADALSEQAARLAGRLREEPAPDLADVAHTLQNGRTQFGVRRAVVCGDLPDAVRMLTGPVDAHSTERQGRPEVAFLLPGVGDHYAGLGQRLYRDEPEFAAVVDQCLRHFRERSDVDLQPMFSAPASAGHESPDLASWLGRNGSGQPSPDDAPPPEETHALIFTVEVALARFLEGWGIRPGALLGYSLGEYAAAHLAGVFHLEDAAYLVAERARLVGRSPRGAMLAVAVPESQTAELLGSVRGPVSIAAANGPSMTVLAGSPEGVEEARRHLTAQGLACARLRTTHAFHSALLEPVRDELYELVASVERRPNAIPMVSNLTGTWLTPGQAVDPGYWADHLCRPVRFADGAGLLAGRDVLVEIGPGSTLGSLVRQNTAVRPETTVLSTLPAALNTGTDERESVLHAIGALWESGVEVDWPTVAGEPRPPISLPTYPFQRTKYWPEGRRTEEADTYEPGSAWCYVPSWQRDAPARLGVRALPDVVVVFADPLGAGARLAELVRKAGGTAFEVLPGQRFEANGDTVTIDPRDATHYRAVADLLPTEPGRHGAVVHCWSLLDPPANDISGRLRGAVDNGFGSLLLLVQALGEQAGKDVRLLTVSAGGTDVTGDDATAPQRSVVHGLGRIVPAEYLSPRWSGVDLEAATLAERGGDTLFAELAAEPAEGVGELTAWRGGRRWHRTWRPATIEQDTGEVWRADGVYLITGGTRGLGMAAARHLAEHGVRRLALVARTTLPERPQWTDLAGRDNRVSRTVRDILALEATGAEVLVLAADAAVPDQLAAALRAARAHFGALHGVLHCAGVPGEGVVQRKTREQAEAVLAPKAFGLAPLLDVVGPDAPEDERLELLVLYSSSVTVLGGPGESDYCAANTVLDAFAAAADSEHTRVLSVAWGPWRHDDWQSAAPGLAKLTGDYRARYGFSDEDGCAVLDRALASKEPNLLVLGQSLAGAAEFWAKLGDFESLAAPAPGETQRFARPSLRTVWVAPRTELERRVATVWERFLGIDGIGADDPFFDLGGNSLVGTAMVRALGEELDLDIAPAVLFTHPTVAAFALWAAGDTAVAPESGRGRGERRRALRTQIAGERKRGRTK
ncbi:type I polyketide synthase [Amycolatopsis sp. GM8]|uniref:type I polyketide synthase n=1 Tax=Amycolatopsis sp. GM8 TaxID=2896530 RepID=UPI001F3DFF3B|nr:type I polyketide synthase [Amycolatopsis sp. GM8]